MFHYSRNGGIVSESLRDSVDGPDLSHLGPAISLMTRLPQFAWFRSSVMRYGVASAAARMSTIVTALVLTPLAIDRLGLSGYTIWVLALTVPNLVASPDLGVSQGLVNRLAEVHLRDGHLAEERGRLSDLTRLLALVALAWLAIGSVACFIYVICFTNSAQLPRDQMLSALLVALAAFILGIPASVWSRAQLAQERGHVPIAWEAGGRLLAFATSLLVLQLCPNVLLLVVASLLPVAGMAWANAWLYSRSLSIDGRLRNRSGISGVYRENGAAIRQGRRFLTLQLIWLATIGSDLFLIGAMEGARGVAYYTIARRPFDLLPLVVGLFSAALWPVFHRLHALGLHNRVRAVLVQLTIGGFFAVLSLSAVVIWFRGPIYSYLGAEMIDISVVDLRWLSIQAAAIVVVMVLTNYLNAVDRVRAQSRIAMVTALPIILLKIGSLVSGDVHDFILVSSAVYVLCVCVPMAALGVVGFRAKVDQSVPAPSAISV